MPNRTGNKPQLKKPRPRRRFSHVLWRVIAVDATGRFAAYERRSHKAARALIPILRSRGVYPTAVQLSYNLGGSWWPITDLLFPRVHKQRPRKASIDAFKEKFGYAPLWPELWDHREMNPLDELIAREEMGLL